MTSHRVEIDALRGLAINVEDDLQSLMLLVASDLLEMHDATGISLDNWPSARGLVEKLIGHSITENGA